MANPFFSFSVRSRVVGVERVDDHRYLVTIDGHHFASFCSESRARAAGRSEARRRSSLDGSGAGRPGARKETAVP
jgi:hypothetical protein